MMSGKIMDNFLVDLTADDSSTMSAAKKPSAVAEPTASDQNSPMSSLFSLSPSILHKTKIRKPRVTKSLSPAPLLRQSPSPHKKRALSNKRKSRSPDVENNGDERNKKRATPKSKKYSHSSVFDIGSESDEEDESEFSFDFTKHARRKIFDDLSSDESSQEDDLDLKPKARVQLMSPSRKESRTANKFKKNTAKAPHPSNSSRSLQDEWMTSHHASARVYEDEQEEDSSDTDDDQSFRPRDWLTSTRRAEKLKYLDTIVNINDKALQLLLWDVGFDYSIHVHQFEAIRFVAGYIPTFPFEQDAKDTDPDDVEEMLHISESGRYFRKKALNPKNDALKRPGRGMILADEMGLGKTIEALAGAALRNYSYECSMKKKKKATLIVTPQDGVQEQWIRSLVNGGVEQARITIIGEKRCDRLARVGKSIERKQGGRFIICTRYKIQSELKRLFEYSPTGARQKTMSKSILFEKVPHQLIGQLRQQYLIEQGKERAPHYTKNEKKQDRVVNIVARANLTKAFETVIIDEAHFLRNVLAYWGLGAAVLGAQSKRTVLLSGTPFNNSNSDMSALMTYIDPQHEAARVKWWDKATSRMSAAAIIQDVGDWRDSFMLRRQKEILGNKLPLREREIINSPFHHLECGVYEYYECIFLKALNQLQEDIDDNNRRRQKEMVDIMMSCMACMRMSLIHPVLPRGREATIQFSPSRRHLLKREEQSKVCVLCDIITPTENAEKFVAIKECREDDLVEAINFRKILGATRARSDENIMDGDDDSGWSDNIKVNDKMKDDKGRMVELDHDLCLAFGTDCCHFAHESCLKIFVESGNATCPKCQDLSSRLHCAGIEKKVYCQEIKTTITQKGGFAASAKIDKAISWFKSIPKSDKAIVLSFFKGSLDLLEGVLTYECGIQCCRYDGDIPKERRAQDLERFKTDSVCRVLLASVQSGGTGLNIVEANHILFMDRWYNPQIHDQAESRCHRLRQKKDVKIAYLDTCYTADVVMRYVNTLKEGNAGVILADGTSLGRNATINYHELAGVLGESLKAVISMRRSDTENGDIGVPLLYQDEFNLENMITDAVSNMRASQKKRSTAKRNDLDSDEESVSGSSLESVVSEESANNACQTKQETLLLRNERPSLSVPSDDESKDSILHDEKPIFCDSTRKNSQDSMAKDITTPINMTVKNEPLALATVDTSSEFVDGNKDNPVDLCL